VGEFQRLQRQEAERSAVFIGGTYEAGILNPFCQDKIPSQWTVRNFAERSQNCNLNTDEGPEHEGADHVFQSSYSEVSSSNLLNYT
jgi:hypothetical protein